jgi:hypothetical protein
VSAPASLECSHCGDVAIESPDGLFGEGDGGACMTCGHPGHVNVDIVLDECEDEGDDEPRAVAYWSVSDEGRCKVAGCDECADRAEAEAQQ